MSKEESLAEKENGLATSENKAYAGEAPSSEMGGRIESNNQEGARVSKAEGNGESNSQEVATSSGGGTGPGLKESQREGGEDSKNEEAASSEVGAGPKIKESGGDAISSQSEKLSVNPQGGEEAKTAPVERKAESGAGENVGGMNENPSRHSGATAEGTQMNTGDGQGVEAAGDALKMPTEAKVFGRRNLF